MAIFSITINNITSKSRMLSTQRMTQRASVRSMGGRASATVRRAPQRAFNGQRPTSRTLHRCLCSSDPTAFWEASGERQAALPELSAAQAQSRTRERHIARRI